MVEPKYKRILIKLSGEELLLANVVSNRYQNCPKYGPRNQGSSRTWN